MNIEEGDCNDKRIVMPMPLKVVYVDSYRSRFAVAGCMWTTPAKTAVALTTSFAISHGSVMCLDLLSSPSMPLNLARMASKIGVPPRASSFSVNVLG